jgi:hypothetical protein
METKSVEATLVGSKAVEAKGVEMNTVEANMVEAKAEGQGEGRPVEEVVEQPGGSAASGVPEGVSAAEPDGRPGAASAAAMGDEGAEARWGAYNELEEEIEAVPEDQLASRRVDMHMGAALVQSVAERDSEPERRVEFERLASVGLYNIGLLARLIKLAMAAWFVREMQLVSQHRASNATLPEGLLQRAVALRAGMIRVVEFWMGSVAEVMTLLSFVRGGNGHKDLALDLRELSRIYLRADFRAKVMPGSPGYDPHDANEAVRLAEDIIAHLGLSRESEAKRWTALSDRVWTLMVRDYEHHCTKGSLIFGEREDVSATYPSLVSALRSAPTRRRQPEPPTQGPGDEPAGESGDEPGDDSVNG